MMDQTRTLRTSTLSKISKLLAAASVSAFCLVMASNAFAACESNATFTAKSTVSFKKSGFGTAKPKPEDLSRGKSEALASAFEQYANECLTGGQLKIYLRDKSKIISQIDSLTTVIFEEQSQDKKALQITTTTKIAVNTNMLAAFFQSEAPSSKSGSAAYMVYIFAGRQAVQTVDGSSGGGSTKAFKAKNTDISSSKSASSDTEMSAQQGDTLMSASQSESMSKTVTGGNVEQKDAIVTGNTSVMGSRDYQMISTKGMDATFKEIMTENGFRPVPYNATRRKCGCVDTEIIESELANSGELSADSWDMISMCLADKCNIPFFAIGTVDANTPQRSKIRDGWWQTQAKITGRVVDLREMFPVDISSFSTKYYDGMGTADNVALEQAMKKMTKITANEITSQMNAAGVR
ncbi:hypothetical protein [Candidatus Puniceispirillum sp.]|uniref:hypothetical protein n=1 Tax=Candidatus Puniceispirillum sp. TaxID=2026719 RepID=UPI001ECF50D8|nr:hypothetical protein [Candidatus Puniceispirillum sp.]